MSQGTRERAFGVKGGAVRERGLKKLPDGRWQYSWKYRARYHRIIAPNYAIAKASLAKVRVLIAEGRFLEKEDKPSVLFEEAVTAFLEWGERHLRDRTFARDKDFALRWRASPSFRGRLMDEINQKDVEAYQQARVSGEKAVGQKTADNDLMRLRRLFALSEEWGYVKGNPARGVKLFRPVSERTRFLTFEEEAAIVKASAPWLGPLITFSSATGVRRGELLSLTWRYVDKIQRTITITGGLSKNKRSRTIPLNTEALEAIRTQPQSITPDLPVFPVAVEKGDWAIMAAFARGLNKSGVDPHEVSWHTLRHTFASRLARSGANLLAIQRLLGHKTLSMVLKYAHLADDDLRQAVETLSPRLQKSCDPECSAPESQAKEDC